MRLGYDKQPGIERTTGGPVSSGQASGWRSAGREAPEKGRIVAVGHLPHRPRRRRCCRGKGEARRGQPGHGRSAGRDGHEQLQGQRALEVVVAQCRLAAVPGIRGRVLIEVGVHAGAAMMPVVMVVRMRVNERCPDCRDRHDEGEYRSQAPAISHARPF